MKSKLSRKLSAQARKLYVQSQATDQVHALVKLSPLADEKALAAEFAQKQIHVSSWMQTEAMVSVRLPASQLAALAEVEGVVFVEAGGTMSSGQTPPSKSTEDKTQSDSPPQDD